MNLNTTTDSDFKLRAGKRRTRFPLSQKLILLIGPLDSLPLRLSLGADQAEAFLDLVCLVSSYIKEF